MSIKHTIKGIIPVVVTPFNEDGSFNIEASKRNLDYLIDNGIKCVCVLGATGEYMSVTNEEHKRYIKEIVPYICERVSVVIGATRERPDDVIDLVKNAKEAGAHAAMVLPPYYCHPSQEEIYKHYEYINNNVDLPLVVYNNPGSAKVIIENDTYKRILQLNNCQSVKESTADLSIFTHLVLNHNDKSLLCGCDNLAYEYFALGADGWISMGANIAPKKCIELYESVVTHRDLEKAKLLYKDLLPLLTLLETKTYPVQAIKYLLTKKNMYGGYVRRPRIELNTEQKKYIDSVIDLTKLY